MRKTKKEKERVERPKRGRQRRGLEGQSERSQKGRGKDEKMRRVNMGYKEGKWGERKEREKGKILISVV